MISISYTLPFSFHLNNIMITYLLVHVRLSPTKPINEFRQHFQQQLQQQLQHVQQPVIGLTPARIGRFE